MVIRVEPGHTALALRQRFDVGVVVVLCPSYTRIPFWEELGKRKSSPRKLRGKGKSMGGIIY